MNYLFIGAHTDDIEHGAGGFLCRALSNPEDKVYYLTFSKCTDLSRNLRIEKDQEAVKDYIQQRGGHVEMLDLPNRCLGNHGQEIRGHLEQIRNNFQPDIVFSHWEHDIHQDHKAVADETIRVFRNFSTLSYECLRSCPGFAPNAFYALKEEEISAKVQLLSLYKTQKELYYLARSATKSLASMRGVAIGCLYAEGFSIVRLVCGAKDVSYRY